MSYDPLGRRLPIEERVARLKFRKRIDDLQHPNLKTVLPKYGTLNFRKGPPAPYRLPTTKDYGGAIAVLKKEAVWDRTTNAADDIYALFPGWNGKIEGTDFTLFRPLERKRLAFTTLAAYYDAQFWGTVGPAEISHLLVPAGTSARQVRKGMPVFEYAIEKNGGHEFARPTKLLFAGAGAHRLTDSQIKGILGAAGR